jgi:hypothetical protein
MKFLRIVAIVILADGGVINARNENNCDTTDFAFWKTVFEVPTVSDEIRIDGNPDEVA